MLFFDHLDRKVRVNNYPPRRIISLVPSQTELIVDLGLGNNLVGVTKFCVHPETLRVEKTVVGGTKQVNFKIIQELKPDIILCNKEENTPEMVRRLTAIAPVHVSDVISLNDALRLIQDYGKIFKVENEASFLSEKINIKFQRFLAKNKFRRSISCVYLIWKDPYMCVGKQTFINSMLEQLNFKNSISESRYPEIDLEEIYNKKPDLVLLSSEPYPFKKKHTAIFQEKGIKTLIVNGEYFSWYGSRLLQSVDYFESVTQFSTSV